MQDHPGHQILEGITSRMWWYLKNPDSKLRFVFLVLWGDGSGRFVKEYLDILGIAEDRILFITKPTQFKMIIVPEQAIYSSTTFTKEWFSVLDQIKQNVEPDQYEKLYLTRKKVRKQDVINEDYFIEFFRKKGFKIIHPEDYSMREKISLFRGAKEVACLGGTNALYTLFSNDDVKLIILGRADAPIYVQYIAYEAFVKNCWIVDTSLNILHKNSVWGIDLVGPTKYWKNFVNDYYHENIEVTSEETLKLFSYDYLKRCAEYYSDPYLFNFFKIFDHFKIINLMNQVFFDTELDPKKYDTSLAEIDISIYINALNFCFDLCIDRYSSHRFDRFIKNLSEKNIAILKQQDKAASVLKKAAEYYGANITFLSNKNSLDQLAPEEFAECQKADVVITCCVHGTRTHERDGVKCIGIWDILRDDSLTADLPEIPDGADNIKIDGRIYELHEDILKLSEHINEAFIKLSKASDETLKEKIKTLHFEKDKLNEELGRLSSENKSLTERIAQITEEKSTLLENILSVSREKESLNSELFELNSKLNAEQNAASAAIRKADSLSADISLLKEKIAQLEKGKSIADSELDKTKQELKNEQEASAASAQKAELLNNKILKMQSTRSWRYTRIFRKNKKDEEI